MGVSRIGQAWNHVDIASKAMAALFRLRPNRLLCAGGACATKHLKETKAFDHFWPSKVMPCRGERRKGIMGGEAAEGLSSRRTSDKCAASHDE
ncbi:hypothetical protein [Sphingobacterium griseoflavum]|uniref:hypothetical protein n=1 Tax=Sphingobacterium griseoflavum TaxID=1474952 RepID=UPI00167A6BB2|nr:hypothetical protein [Sphingobacterium griseoflavum]